MNKLNQNCIFLENKINVLNVNQTAKKRLLGNVLVEVANLRSNLDVITGESTINIIFPIENQEALIRLEKLSKEKEGEMALRKRFNKESTMDLYDFFRNNIQNLFSNTDRYTYSGKLVKNTTHGADVNKAADMNIIRILLGKFRLLDS